MLKWPSHHFKLSKMRRGVKVSRRLTFDSAGNRKREVLFEIDGGETPLGGSTRTSAIEPTAVSLRTSRTRQTDTESNAWGRWQQQRGSHRCQLVEPLSNFAQALPHKHRRQCQPSTAPAPPPSTTLTTTARWGKTIRTHPKRGEVKCAIGEGLQIDKARPIVVGC